MELAPDQAQALVQRLGALGFEMPRAEALAAAGYRSGLWVLLGLCGLGLLALARRISASVLETFGVPIEPEPRLIGAQW